MTPPSELAERSVDLPLGRTRILERPGDGERAVVFLHGITSSARTWEPFLTSLPPGVRGVALDTFGNAGAELRGGRRPITIEDHANQVVELAAELGIERFAGVGHSMGCAPLLRLAWQRPAIVSGLLLEAPTAFGRPKLSTAMRLARFGPTANLLERIAPRFVPREARRAVIAFAGVEEADEETVEREAGHALADPKRQVRGFRDLIGHGTPRKPAADVDRYARIECPVWILRGSEDHDWMPEAYEERYRKLIPGARVDRWQDIGHAPHIQAPERFAGLLDEFLRATTV